MISRTLILCLTAVMTSLTIAQTPLEQQVKVIINDNQKGEAYLKEYLQPMSIAFGTIMGSALFHRASVKSLPGFDMGISFVKVHLPDEANYFQWTESRVPTIFGPDSDSENDIGGNDLQTISVPQIQLNLGLFADFELVVRGISSYRISEMGKIDIFGAGFKYGLSDLISSPDYFFDLSVQATYHILRVKRWLDAGSFAMNIQFSKEFTLLTLGLYAGLGYEAISVTVDTEKISGTDDLAKKEIKLGDQNYLRLILGTSLTFYYVTFHIDYNFSEYPSVAGGIKVVF